MENHLQKKKYHKVRNDDTEFYFKLTKSPLVYKYIMKISFEIIRLPVFFIYSKIIKPTKFNLIFKDAFS